MCKVEQLRQSALAKVRENALEDALALFDQALALAADEETVDLLTINKAGVLIDLGREGREIQRLPEFVVRRRSPKQTFLAARHLHAKHNLARNFTRARHYGRIALDVSVELENPDERWWRVAVINDLGNTCVLDSRISEAIGYFREAVTELEPRCEQALECSIAMESLGYCLMLEGELDAGIATVHRALELIRSEGSRADLVAESGIDLCYGYLAAGRLEEARRFGEMGLAFGTEPRQIRNARYLLGEVALHMGDESAADGHFRELARLYPEFPHLRSVLMAIDFRGLVNLKL